MHTKMSPAAGDEESPGEVSSRGSGCVAGHLDEAVEHGGRKLVARGAAVREPASGRFERKGLG
jgi:hypothetical protein